MGEVEITKLDKRIAAEVKRSMDQNQREYYLHEQIKAIRKELGETEQNEAEKYTRRLKEKEMPQAVREKLEREIARFGDLPAASHEQPPMRNYIECMLDLPWSEETKDDLDIEHARAILDNDHYGMEKVKQRILEHIAVARLTGKVNGQIICFAGPPGVGKTCISASSIARALGPQLCADESSAAYKDEAEIRGHRRTYIGRYAGAVLSPRLRQAGSRKSGACFLTKLTSLSARSCAATRPPPCWRCLDGAQNFRLPRSLFWSRPYDLSKVHVHNHGKRPGRHPPPASGQNGSDRGCASYLATEKVEIAKTVTLIPKQLEKHGLKKMPCLPLADEAIV